jgi:hypothetical protein
MEKALALHVEAHERLGVAAGNVLDVSLVTDQCEDVIHGGPSMFCL